jgi:Bifunctional DNA primase/polymerase, N-terminal
LSTTESRRAAVGLIRRGIAVIAVPSGEKNPNRSGWHEERITEEDVPFHWTNGQNVGLLCGEPSGGRVDVDLDADEAVKIAGRFLYPTLTSGRESRPHSHWWYVAPGAESCDWKDSDGSKLVELRSTGRQTLVAPSLHPDGDEYVWHTETGLKMAEIGAAELTRRLGELATTVMIARYLPLIRTGTEGGGRHDYALALAGFLLRSDRLDTQTTLRILTAAWDAKGWPGEKEKREAHRDLEGIVRDTAENLAAGQPVVGGPTLEEMAPGVVRLLCKWWGWSREDRGDDTAGTDAEERKPTQAELLVRCANGVDLFHTPAGDSYATVPVGDHHETHLVKAKGFRRWLVRAYFERYDRPPGNQALQDALGLLEARALFDGPAREVYVRVAGHTGNIYIDLATKDWQVVEITPAGWRVVSGEDAPVRFRRPRGMLALPTPLPASDGDDGCDGLLRRFFNVSDEEDLRLIIAWFVAALRPTGPYPVLLFQGEQGSAKSTAERLVRTLVDPSAAPLRTVPRSEHDLYIAADNAHVIALDNISTLPPWLSDALCRLSTGGGFSTRTLFENREEELFDGMKPVILNGITDVATRPDLLDRALVVSLPPIPDEERRPEAELWREFEQARPALLASLLDAASGALRSVEDVRLEGMPRMADFAVWATAAEESLGWDTGTFMAAYEGNRQEAADSALEADPVAVAVLDFMADKDQWTGSATELWMALGELVDEGVRKTKAWPGAPNALTSKLKRLAPTLRGVGIEYDEDRSGRSRKKVLTKNGPAKDRHDRHQRHDEGFPAEEGQMRGDGAGDSLSVGDGPDRHCGDPLQMTVTPESRIDKGNAGGNDGDDGRDGDMQADSNAPLRGGRPLPDVLEPDQSATLPELAARKCAEGAGAQMRRAKSGPALALKAYLEKPNDQRLEWLTKAVLKAQGLNTAVWRRIAPVVKAAAEDRVNHPLDCDCGVCL